MIEAVEDAKAEGRVSEDLEAGGRRVLVACSWWKFYSRGRGRGPGVWVELRFGAATTVVVALTLTPDVVDILTKLLCCMRRSLLLEATGRGVDCQLGAMWATGGQLVRGGLSSTGWRGRGMVGRLVVGGWASKKVGRFWAKLGCFRGFFSCGTHAPPLGLDVLGGPPAAAVIEMRLGQVVLGRGMVSRAIR